jgi:uncharacterized membrane protein YkvA (DUF1232 family)
MGLVVLAKHLSFADRENLLETIRKLSGEEFEVDYLLKLTGDWAHSLKPKFGFEQALLRNVMQLSNYLRLHQNATDIATIASGAINFIVKDQVRYTSGIDQNNCSFDDLDEFHALGKAFVASYAVHEISMRLGSPVSYHPPAITKDEQVLAEDIFEKLSSANGCDSTLALHVHEKLEQIKELTSCGFLKRFATNALALVEVLADPEHPVEDKVCARGALRYLLEKDDAIKDELGLVGYLDDLFILQTAVELISPQREPLIELLDRVVGVWPFLNMLTLDDGSGPRPASEFAILNSALSCRKLRSEDTMNTLLIAPETGPIAVLIGFVSTLGLAHESGVRKLTEESFNPGQKVLVDYEAVATFEGFDTLGDGRRMFKLRKNRTERGEKNLGSITYWPMSDLRRIVPVDSKRDTRGNIDWIHRNKETAICGLEFLFNGPNRTDVHAISKQVIVVMPTTLAMDFCSKTLLYGQPIKEVVPIGQISAEGESTERWTARFGTQTPVLLFASDLDTACIYAQDHRDEIEQIIVDVTGRNREKHASIKRLNRLKIPCLLIVSERTENEIDLAKHNDLSVWEWEGKDLEALVWPESFDASLTGSIAKFENKVRATSSARPTIEKITLPVVGETYKSFCSLRRLAKRREANSLPELDTIVAEAFFAITHLMRCATTLNKDSPVTSSIEDRLRKISSSIESSNYLSDNERTAAVSLAACIRNLLRHLLEHNPKAAALSSMLSRYPLADIMCPDARLLTDLQLAFKSRPNRIFTTFASDETFSNGLILTGWFKQSRMSSMLSPPIADPMVLLLYDVECRWHQQFSNQRQLMRQSRTSLKGRSTIFPSMSGWKQPRLPDAPQQEVDVELDDYGQIQTEIDDGFRTRILDQVRTGASDADVKARMIVFSGGYFGLFTDNYRLNVVTHLLDGSTTVEDEKASVRPAAAKELVIGDQVVFRPKSRDLIREVADTLLKPGQRETASLWQTALRSYKERYGLSDEMLCRQLQVAGCKAGDPAIRNWINFEGMIAPQQYETDLRVIAEVTGDTTLSSSLDEVIDAIKHVRSAHQQLAPRVIAKQVRSNAAKIVRDEHAGQAVVHLDDDLVLVRVVDTASELLPVKYVSANRLIEGDSWRE